MERPVSEVMEVLVENDEMNQMETVQAVYKWNKAENKIAVLNHAPVDIKILKNSSLGFISQVKVDKEENDKQTQSYVEKVNSMSDEHKMQVVEDLGL